MSRLYGRSYEGGAYETAPVGLSGAGYGLRTAQVGLYGRGYAGRRYGAGRISGRGYGYGGFRGYGGGYGGYGALRSAPVGLYGGGYGGYGGYGALETAPVALYSGYGYSDSAAGPPVSTKRRRLSRAVVSKPAIPPDEAGVSPPPVSLGRRVARASLSASPTAHDLCR
jgi:hypothetical protein